MVARAPNSEIFNLNDWKELKQFTTEMPEATRSHKPVAHDVVAQLAWEIATQEYGLVPTNQHWQVTKAGQRFFGQMEFEVPGNSFYRHAIGLRGSWDKSFSHEMVAGSSIFVCSNGMFLATGEEGSNGKAKRRHTTNALNELGDRFRLALEPLEAITAKNIAWSEGLKKTELTNRQGHLLLGAMQGLNLINQTVRKVASDHWNAPAFEEFVGEKNLFGLQNALTWGAHKARPKGKFEAHTNITQFVDSIQVNDEGNLVLS